MDRFVILDVNNLLVDKWYHEGQLNVVIRPGAPEFLEELLEDYRVAFWTSMTENTLSTFIDELVDSERLEFIWTRDRCLKKTLTKYEQYTLTEEELDRIYNARMEYVVKPLDLVYKNPVINADNIINSSNTVIVDNDPGKVADNPMLNNIIVDSYYSNQPETETFEQIRQRIDRRFGKIPVRMLRIQDIQGPFHYFRFQTYDGLTEDGEIPYVSLRTSYSFFIPDSKLQGYYHSGSKQGKCTKIKNWENKPVYPRLSNSPEDYFYLPGISVEGKTRLQICYDPSNVVSEDCMDEVNCWVPSIPL